MTCWSACTNVGTNSLVHQYDAAPQFRPFWAHDRDEERRAFEGFMDFIGERLRRYPDMHIYHYAHYEPTALKRLMSFHGTRESALDDLLRQGRFVDLYKVVREGIRTSEPGQSLKDIEHFYLPPREGEVTDAVRSRNQRPGNISTADLDSRAPGMTAPVLSLIVPDTAAAFRKLGKSSVRTTSRDLKNKARRRTILVRDT